MKLKLYKGNIYNFQTVEEMVVYEAGFLQDKAKSILKSSVNQKCLHSPHALFNPSKDV